MFKLSQFRRSQVSVRGTCTGVMCQERWLPYLWALVWLFYQPLWFRWTLVSMYLHQWLSLVWRCQTSLFSFPRVSLLAPATQGDLITKAHVRHSLGRTRNCGSILSRIWSVQCQLAVLWVFIFFFFQVPKDHNKHVFALQRLKKGYVQRFSTFQTRKGLHDLLLLHSQVLSENKGKSPCFLTANPLSASGQDSSAQRRWTNATSSWWPHQSLLPEAE